MTLYRINLDWVPTPAARPRLGRRGVYIPTRSTQDVHRLRDIARTLDIPSVPPPARWGVEIEITSKSRRRRDLDNIIKTIMDGLTPRPMWDDSIAAVTRITASYAQGDRDETTITIRELT